MSILTLSVDDINQNDLLCEWRWLVPQSMAIHSITALGDLFLRDSDGSFYWLDAAGGALSRIADSEEIFQAILRDESKSDNWLMPHVVSELAAQGIRLLPSQCYSYKKPPCLGGSFEADNFEPTDLSVHFSILGQIHAQIKDLPAGTPIGKLNFK